MRGYFEPRSSRIKKKKKRVTQIDYLKGLRFLDMFAHTKVHHDITENSWVPHKCTVAYCTRALTMTCHMRLDMEFSMCGIRLGFLESQIWGPFEFQSRDSHQVRKSAAFRRMDLPRRGRHADCMNCATGTKTSDRQEGEIYLGFCTVSVFIVGKHGGVAQPVAVGT